MSDGETPTVGLMTTSPEVAIRQERPARALRRALTSGQILRAGGVHDGLSALVADRCGLDALWASGLGIAASHGVPDANILTMGEVRDAARVIVSASSLPVIADCDTGFGEARNLRRTVREFEHAGVAAICIEDKLYPKRNSFGPEGQELIDPHEFATKVRAAKQTQRHEDFMIIARIESLIAGESMDAALQRAELYADAGADAIIIHSKQSSADQVLAFAREWRDRARSTPLVAIPTTYSSISAVELEQAGFAMVIYANQILRAALGAMERAMHSIIEQGSCAQVEHDIPSVASLFELTGEETISSYDRWFAQTLEQVRQGYALAPDTLRA